MNGNLKSPNTNSIVTRGGVLAERNLARNSRLRGRRSSEAPLCRKAWWAILMLLWAMAPLPVCVNAFAAESPTFIPFQGRLTDQAGNTYTNGQYTILFQLYGQAVGGQAIWQERHDKVGVINGLVNAFLGSINPLTSVDFGSTKHLGITIDADNNPNTPEPEMIPRQMIIAAFWAKNSEKLAGADWTPIFGVNSPSNQIPAAKIQSKGITAGQIAPGAVGTAELAANSVSTGNIADGQVTPTKLSSDLQLMLDQITPAGTISAFGSTNIPSGWLLCDGAPLSSAQYPRLYTALSTNWGAGVEATTNDFNLPDLRGVFLRGKNFTRATDTGNTDGDKSVGTYEKDLLKTHQHGFKTGNGVVGSWHPPRGDDGGWTHQFYTEGFSPESVNDIGNETRPRNVTVVYIIKY